MKKGIFKIILIGVVGLWLSSFAFGIGINVHCTGTAGSGKAYSHNNQELETTSVIQWIYGNPGAPDPKREYFLHSGSLYQNYNVGHGTNNQKGTFDINTTANQTSYLRVWENSGPKEGGYYWTLGPFTPGDPLPSENNVSNFYTKYKAAKPPKPKSTAGGFSLQYDSNTGRYLPTFTISAVDQSDPNEPGVLFETVGYNLAIRKKGDSWDPSRTYAVKSKTITETNADNPYFLADGKTEYEVKAQAWNYFGGDQSDDWGESYFFTIPATVGGPATSFTFNLYGAQPEKLIVNSIALPKFSLSKPEAVTVGKASDLAGVINRKAGEVIVRAICRWDPASGRSQAANFDAEGKLRAGSNDFDLQPGVGYQVYTTKSLENIVFE